MGFVIGEAVVLALFVLLSWWAARRSRIRQERAVALRVLGGGEDDEARERIARAQGILGLAEDGIWGPQSRAAARRRLQRAWLYADGYVARIHREQTGEELALTWWGRWVWPLTRFKLPPARQKWTSEEEGDSGQ